MQTKPVPPDQLSLISAAQRQAAEEAVSQGLIAKGLASDANKSVSEQKQPLAGTEYAQSATESVACFSGSTSSATKDLIEQHIVPPYAVQHGQVLWAVRMRPAYAAEVRTCFVDIAAISAAIATTSEALALASRLEAMARALRTHS